MALRVLVAAIFLMTGFMSFASAADPVKIGFVTTFSGRLSVHGSLSKQGAELAVKEINNAGGILGRKVEAIFEDDGGDPKKGAEAAKKLVQSDKVDALMGVISSEVALEVSNLSRDLRVPFIITTAQMQSLTGSKCAPYTFRVCRSSDGLLRTASALAVGLKANDWTTIGPDTAFGHECWDMFRKYLGKLKPNVKFASQDRTVFAPMTNTDWTPQIQKAIQSGSDGVLISIYAGNLIDFLKQANNQGFFDGKRVVIAALGSLQTLMSLGTEMPQGVWFTPPYWFGALDSTVNRQFVSQYQSEYASPPDYQAQFAYGGVKAFAAAVQNAGSTQKDAVAAALEGLELELPVGRTTIRKEDHQAVYASFVGVTSAKPGVIEGRQRKTAYRPLEQGSFFKAEEVSSSVEDAGCRMQRPVIGMK